MSVSYIKISKTAPVVAIIYPICTVNFCAGTFAILIFFGAGDFCIKLFIIISVSLVKGYILNSVAGHNNLALNISYHSAGIVTSVYFRILNGTIFNDGFTMVGVGSHTQDSADFSVPINRRVAYMNIFKGNLTI